MFPTSYLPIRCFNKHACSGEADKTTHNRTCTEGYDGVMCAMCKDTGNGTHYWKNPSTYHCHECKSMDAFRSLIYKASIVGSFFFFVALCVKVFTSYATDQSMEIIGMIRIIILTAQFLIIITKM